MSKTRNNHYVAQWYQEGFFENGRNTLDYLDLTPERKTLDDGRVITGRALFDSPTSRAFRQMDLYSTFFGTSINDEIERRLFGDIDTKGANAVRAFAGTDVGEWHRHFQTLFEYIDIQKIRTPKGLDWLKAQYPALTQNDLMYEMQGIRMMHCTIWTEGVREIVSAEDSDVRFIVTDHPVTIYNYAAPPRAPACAYPHDPAIALRASQTIFPLNRLFCLVLTNLEYARDPSTSPLAKRTSARNYRNSLARTDAFIRTRKLTGEEVSRVNFILKARARRYIAAGRPEWLYPEKTLSGSWEDLRATLQPPEDELWHFGGEMYVKYDSGHVHYQDEFGRTEKPREFLKKDLPVEPLRPKDICGCGSGRSFEACCSPKPLPLRPSWSERSIRERNIMLHNGISKILGLDDGKDWIQVRRDLTDAQIREIYLMYEALWPLETDLLSLLPKPDGIARSVYTGSIHPNTIVEFALGASLYFGELLIEHPFLHAGTVKKEYSPVDNPRAFRQEFLKAVICFLNIMPLVDAGLINLIPDPCNFDLHLRDQMLHMAKSRGAGLQLNPEKEPRLKQLMEQDAHRGLMSLPRGLLRSQLRKASPELDENGLEETLKGIEALKERDPLAVLQEYPENDEEKFEQFNMMKLVPNFEMSLYIAQATGSSIVTDNSFRWEEICRAIYRTARRPEFLFPALGQNVGRATFAFPQDGSEIVALAADPVFAGYPALLREVSAYLSKCSNRDRMPYWEAHLAVRFGHVHPPAQSAIGKAPVPVKQARVSCAFPLGGIQDNTVSRLLLMSSSEHHLPNVPMAFFIREQAPGSSPSPQWPT
jgi:hypothetical protein